MRGARCGVEVHSSLPDLRPTRLRILRGHALPEYTTARESASRPYVHGCLAKGVVTEDGMVAWRWMLRITNDVQRSVCMQPQTAQDAKSAWRGIAIHSRGAGMLLADSSKQVLAVVPEALGGAKAGESGQTGGFACPAHSVR